MKSSSKASAVTPIGSGGKDKIQTDANVWPCPATADRSEAFNKVSYATWVFYRFPYDKRLNCQCIPEIMHRTELYSEKHIDSAVHGQRALRKIYGPYGRD